MSAALTIEHVAPPSQAATTVPSEKILQVFSIRLSLFSQNQMDTNLISCPSPSLQLAGKAYKLAGKAPC